MMSVHYKSLFLSIQICLFFLFVSCQTDQTKLSIYISHTDPQIEFGINEIKTSLANYEITIVDDNQAASDFVFNIDNSDKNLEPEGYRITKKGHTITVYARESAGLMYGALELAEQLQLYGKDGVKEVTHNPYLEMRGPKFNIPLDVRTPSYSDASDAGQKNIPVMWEMDFWTEFIDELARHRYNYISLWSLHPFPSLVKVPGYEKIALDDVQRSTGKWENLYNLNGIGMGTPEILENPEIIKEISIDEKIAFWKEVMAYGKKRNIDFHIITWNIFDYGTGGQYGISDELNNEITQDYFRKSIEQLFITYPDLAGIGLTTGENMKDNGERVAPKEREDWAYETYAKGILAAAKKMPERDFVFIHRQHQSGAKEIIEKFKPVVDAPNVEFLFCFKYAKAHVYSSTTQPYHEEGNFMEDIAGVKTLWGLRNDDTYYYRWGAPDFVREFIQNLPYTEAKGIYFGSDQWIWGRDFLSKDPVFADQLEIKKQWYQWMLWGRMSFDPSLSNQRLIDILGDKYPEVDNEILFDTWQNASMVYPVTTGFHWGRLDFQWYIEACFSHPKPAETESGFHDVNRFITLGTHPKTNNQNIPDFVKMKMEGESNDLTSPLEVAQKLHLLSDKAISQLEKMEPGTNKELAQILNDIESMSYLGKYYAHKIAGSTYTAWHRASNNAEHQDQAVQELTSALDFWKKYIDSSQRQYHNPLWTNRVGKVDFEQITKWVANDIKIAKNETI